MTVESERASEELLVAIQRLGRLMGSRRVSTAIADSAGAGITQQGVQILRALLREGELPVAGLAASAHLDVSAVSRQLKLLEDAGLAQRTPSPADGRVAFVSLTRSGRKVAERIRQVGLEHLTSSLAGWSDDDLEQLGRLMARLVADLQGTDITPTE